MTKCSQRYKLPFGFALVREKHSFIISNAFYTLEDHNKVDVVKTCQVCGFKEAFSLVRGTLLESVVRFPNAFRTAIRSYLQSWMN